MGSGLKTSSHYLDVVLTLSTSHYALDIFWNVSNPYAMSRHEPLILQHSYSQISLKKKKGLSALN